MALSMFILHLKHLQLRLTNSKMKLSFGSKLFQVIWKASSLRCVCLHHLLKLSANLRVFFKLSGAKVLRINGADPFVAVNKNAKITGGYQAFGTRQNSYESFFFSCMILVWNLCVHTSFFSSYNRGATGWQYSMGNFALQAHPLVDDVELTVQRENSLVTDTFRVCTHST